MTTRNGYSKARDAAVRVTVPPVHRVPAHLARRFHQICLGVLSEVTQPEDLSPVEYAVLGSLDDSPGIDQRTLADRIGVDVVSAHQLIGKLEARDLVEQTIAPNDRRARALTLTEKGARLRRRLRPLIAKAHDKIMAPLSARECAAFIDMLGRIVDANEAYARPGNGRRRPRRGAQEAAP
jgi:MarR family transcriptional regulator, temperature-dependent positive regulator of motility